MKHLPAGQSAGIYYIVGACLCFAALDTSTKVAGLLAPVLMLLWFRYLFQAVATAALRAPVQGRSLLVTRNPRFQLVRGVLLLITSAFSFYGLQVLPVGEFTAIIMLTPLLVTVLAAVQLHEKVSPLRWALLVGGLAGALLVVRPGGQVFGWGVLLPVGMVVSYAFFQALTRRMAVDENPYTTHFYTGLVGTLVMSCIVPWAWSTQALLAHWPWFMALGFFGTFGHLLLIRAFARAPASVLTPYLYSQIAFGTAGGWLAFKHTPDGVAWLGIALVAVCGIASGFLSAREYRSRQASALPAQG
ncbi:MAG: DMT family transporter [Burkholderiaceae bacterium]